MAGTDASELCPRRVARCLLGGENRPEILDPHQPQGHARSHGSILRCRSPDARHRARDEASQGRGKMLADGLSVATVRLYVGNARQFFGEAARRELIPKNVFDHLPAGTTPANNERYVTPEEAERDLAAIPDHGIRVVF